MPVPRVVPTLLVGALSMSACGSSAEPVPSTDSTAVTAVAAFYPLQFVLGRVGGARVAVEGLTPPGAEPHELELGARQAARVSDADLLVHLAGFQPAVDQAAEGLGDRAFDVAAAVDLREGYAELEGDEQAGEEERSAGLDPHVWLDPALLADVGDALGERLAEADEDGAQAYRAGAAALRRDLEALDAEFRAGLRTCQRRQIVVSQNAFGYLTARYDLEQVGISGLSPEQEPSPGEVAEAIRYA